MNLRDCEGGEGEATGGSSDRLACADSECNATANMWGVMRGPCSDIRWSRRAASAGEQRRRTLAHAREEGRRPVSHSWSMR